MNVFIRELRANRKSLIIWSLCIILMVIMGMTKFKSYESAGQSMKDLLADMPNSLRAVLGFGDFDVSKASGFYAMLFMYLQLMTAIHAVMLGAGIIAKEERDKTTEFLMIKPVSRASVITSKLCAGFVNIIIINAVTFISSYGIVNGYSNGEDVLGIITKLMAGMFIIQLLFISIGAGLASAGKTSKASASIGAGILLAVFVFGKIIDVNEKLKALEYLTPFKYFEPKRLMFGNGFEPVFIIISVVIISAMFTLIYVSYNKRDLKI